MTAALEREAAGRRSAPGPGRGHPGRSPAPAARSLGRQAWAVLAVAAVIASLAGAARGEVVNTGGWPFVAEFFAAALDPRLDPHFLAMTLNATVITLAYAVLGTALSLVIGVVAGVFTSQTWWRSGARMRGRRNRPRTAGWAGVRAALILPRGIHEVVWGLAFLSVFGLEPVVAVLAIGIPFGAVTAKVYADILDETGQAPYSALIASGAPRWAAMAYGLVPLALPDMVSYAFYRFECAIRSAAVLGFVGAGGLGFQLQLSFQALRYPEMWTLLYALIAISAAADLWSSAVRRRAGANGGRPALQGRLLARLPVRGLPAAVGRLHPRLPGAATARRGPGRDRLLTASLAVALALVPLSVWAVGLDLSVLWAPRSRELAAAMLAGSWPPELGPGGIVEIVRRSATTLAMSILAIALAFLGGALLAFFAAGSARSGSRRPPSRAVRIAGLLRVAATRGVLLVLRAIPPPVWAVLLLFVFFPGILPGALALGVYTLGVLGRLMAESVDNLDERPLLALRGHGASPVAVFLYGTLPAVLSRFAAYGLYRWEVTIRETVVVGVVGAGGLGLLLDQQLATFDYAGVTATLIALLALTLGVDLVSAAVRRSLR